jgi:hypothetical protein
LENRDYEKAALRIERMCDRKETSIVMCDDNEWTSGGQRMNLQLKERILQQEKYSIGQSTGRKSDCLSQVTVSRDIGRKKVERTDRGKRGNQGATDEGATRINGYLTHDVHGTVGGRK